MNKNENKSVFILFVRLIALTLLVSMFPLIGNLSAEEQQKPEKAYRVTLKYHNGKMDSLIVESLYMVIPLTLKEQIMKDGEHPEGYFFEMFDEKGNLVLRSNMQDPTVTLLEYEDPENPGRIKGELVKHDKITFSIIVPAPTEARSIHFARVIPSQDSIPVEKRRHEILGTSGLTQD